MGPGALRHPGAQRARRAPHHALARHPAERRAARGPRPLRRQGTLRLNNLVSFSLDATEAGCFGDTVFRTALPACKLLVFPGLLPGQVLQGEQEVLALGGDVEVEIVHV
jgi:NAD+--dinitrogen-reductase ADP-D-ribosyltransferase